MRAAALALVLVLLGGPRARAQVGIPPALSAVRIDQRLGAQVPLDLTFRDEQARPVRLGEVGGGKPVLLVLAYIRCPRLCSVVLQNVVECARGIPFDAGQQYQVVVVSFDPREGPELAAAAKRKAAEDYGRPGAENGWHFLTGEEPAIRRLADAVGFRYIYDAKKDEYRHSAGIMVLTPRGKVARYFFGIRYPARDVRLGLVEASEGKIAAPADRALLMACLSYDPQTGNYTVAVMKLLRLAAALTVLALAAYMAVNWRRARRKALAEKSPQRSPRVATRGLDQ
jgi:protein SCO1/2